MKQEKKLTEVIRFAVTGGVCFLIEFGLLVLLKSVCNLDTLIATPIAFLASVIVNYLLCVIWVFKQAKDGSMTAKAGFLVTSLVGLLLNELLMFLFRILFGEEQIIMTLMGFHINMYMLNKCMATLLVMIWNYFSKKAVLTSGLMKRFNRNE